MLAKALALTITVQVAMAAPLGATVVSIDFQSPTLDRWNYPFASDPGGNPYAAIFAPLTSAGFDPSFDNRDGQMVIGFDTTGLVTPNLGINRYTVLSATLFATVESSNTFSYDPTPDSYRTWLPPDDPDYIPDTDPGHAVEVFGTGFRFGFNALTYTENVAYSPMGAFGKGIRTAYPRSFLGGQCVDVSNNVDARFDPLPFGVAMNTNLTPGQLVPAGTEMRFDINLSNADIHRVLREGLNEGMLDFSIASIFPSAQQTAGTYPRFYCKENLAVMLGLAHAARLQMSVNITDAPLAMGDVNANGVVNVDDLLGVINAWGACPCCAADVNGDGMVNVDDLLAVINSWG